MPLTIERFCQSDQGTFGTLYINGVQFFTVERPWRNNERGVSCIPCGSYICDRRWFWRGNYAAIEVTSVPNRSHILFHRGNTMHDVRGCIAIGSSLAAIAGTWAVHDSRPAFDYLMEHWGERKFELKIIARAIQ